MNNRIYNFGAGPAMLPEAILKEAQGELLNWHHLGISVLEVGHRTTEFQELLQYAESTLRELIGIPDHYHVLFLGGAARTQFSMIPMNLLPPEQKSAYLISGVWSNMAFQEAQHLKKAYCIASSEADNYKTLPNAQKLALQKDTAYVYYTPNETVNGVRFPYIPETGDVPLIADMTSCLLSEPVDINRYGLIFAGAQKNIANAGLTVVIVRDDLINKLPVPAIPSMMNYKLQAEHHSIYATPPTFNCYLAAKMFDWIKAQGGVDEMFRNNCLKAAKLYQYLDASTFYETSVSKEARSIVNICFSLVNPDLETTFIKQAEYNGLLALKGHRFVGGLRASLYNAMPMSGVDALITFMSQFAEDNS